MLATVDSRELKQAFHDIKPLLASAENDRVLTFTTVSNSLVIMASNGMMYEKIIPVRCPDYFTVTVRYEDLYELISGSGSCVIDLTEAAVSIDTGVASITLQAAFTSRTSYVPMKDGTVHKLGPDFKESIMVLSPVSALSKIFLKEASYVFDGEHITVKYPTVWVRAKCNCRPTAMSKRDADVLARFSPTSCSARGGVLEFSRGNALFATSEVSLTEQESFDNLVSDLELQSYVTSASLLATLRKIALSLGKGHVKLVIYKLGISLIVERPSARLSMSHGDTSTDYIDTVDVPLEYLIMCATMAHDSNLQIAVGGGKLWIHSNNADTLISV
jgi:hypothetical protein